MKSRHGICAWVVGSAIVLVVEHWAVAQPANVISVDKRSNSYQALRAVRSAPESNRYSGAAVCSGCHSGLGAFPQDVLNRVCLTEYKTWLHADRHSEAYSALASERAVRMGRLLDKDVFNIETGCVQCHSLAAELPDAVYEQPSRQALLKEGVGCEACHGPSSKWLGEHFNHDAWQAVSLDAKTSLGWIDVRSPTTRAEECISCHLGSAEHGRIITHDMYAAGHPPLAGFELESFADVMPRHWRYPQEKRSNAKQSFQRTQNLLIAVVVTMRMAVELAAADSAAPQQAARWPELARLDCFACHHDLKSAGGVVVNAQAKPGRPSLVVGCLPLVHVAAATVAESRQVTGNLNALTETLRTPFESNPFGDAAKLAQAGQLVTTWCRDIEQGLELTVLTPEQARGVLHQIAGRAKDEFHDYDTARQLLGAWLVVYGELEAAGELRLAADGRRRIDELRRALDKQYPGLAALGPMTMACGAEPPAKRDYFPLLEQQYNNRTQYEPQQFRTLMSELAGLVPEK